MLDCSKSSRQCSLSFLLTYLRRAVYQVARLYHLRRPAALSQGRRTARSRWPRCAAPPPPSSKLIWVRDARRDTCVRARDRECARDRETSDYTVDELCAGRIYTFRLMSHYDLCTTCPFSRAYCTRVMICCLCVPRGRGELCPSSGLSSSVARLARALRSAPALPSGVLLWT